MSKTMNKQSKDVQQRIQESEIKNRAGKNSEKKVSLHPMVSQSVVPRLRRDDCAKNMDLKTSQLRQQPNKTHLRLATDTFFSPKSNKKISLQLERMQKNGIEQRFSFPQQSNFTRARENNDDTYA